MFLNIPEYISDEHHNGCQQSQDWQKMWKNQAHEEQGTGYEEHVLDEHLQSHRNSNINCN